ncbi:hypothetical protein [Roseiconus lacunae]|uniref:hypothetical protein n=1 Tax=Roseiconus lacunae TaxID=2605694 RepID=UPI001E30E4A6|nr:hypothetical protein [Roseiconus lacunae]
MEFHIQIDGASCIVSPRCSNHLAGIFDHDGIEFAHDNGRLQFRRGGTLNVIRDLENSTVVPAGFLHRVRRHLEEAGHCVVVEDRVQMHHDPLLRNGLNPTELEHEHPVFVRALREKRMGIIERPRGRSRAALVAQIAESYPAARILVIASTHKTIGRFYEHLRPILQSTVLTVVGQNRAPRARVVIGTQSVLQFSEARNHNILVFEDIDDTINQSISSIISHEWPDHYRIAFRSGIPSSRRHLLVHEGLFGDVILSPSDPGVSQPRVCFVQYSQATVPDPMSARERFNRLWQLGKRNMAIGQLATAWTRYDPARPDPLEQIDPAIAIIPPEMTALRSGGRNVLVLAGSESQKKGLVDVIAKLTGILPIDSDTYARFASQDGQILVATSAGARRLRHVGQQLVIVAGGGRQPGLPEAIIQSCEVRVICDFVDECCATYLDDSHSRARCFRELDLDTIGISDRQPGGVSCLADETPVQRPRRRRTRRGGRRRGGRRQQPNS